MRRDACPFIDITPNKKGQVYWLKRSAGICAIRSRDAGRFVFVATRSVLYMPRRKRVTPTMSATEKMLGSQSIDRRAAFISWRRLAVAALIVVMLIAGG